MRFIDKSTFGFKALIIFLISSLFMQIGLVESKRTLSATSLVSCMENSQLVAESFDIYFDPDSSALHYSLNINSEISGKIHALLDVYAYGFKIITKDIDVCSIGWKQFCPISPGNIDMDSIQYISETYTKEIPGISYQVPDIDAFVRLQIVKADDVDGPVLACIQAFFTNGKTVAQTGVKWVTAIIAGIGILTSVLLATLGNSVAASHIGANAMSLFLYFQSVVIVAMEHVEYVPPIAAAWSENLVWSMGLIHVNFMQKIFRWYIDSTGGTSALYLTSTSQSVLVQKVKKRSLEYLETYLTDIKPFVKRAKELVLYGNSNVKIFRGIKRLGYKMDIENTNIVPTGFTFFLLCGYFLVVLIILCKWFVKFAIKHNWMKNSRLIHFRKHWRMVLKGALLKYFFIGFTQVAILGMWEFFERDSAAVIVIAIILLVVVFGLMIWSFYNTYYFGKQSLQNYKNPAAILYGDQKVLTKYGWFYSMFNAEFYWWGGIVLFYNFMKALFIALAQGSGKTQALAIFIIELVYFANLIRYKPYLDRITNILNILIASVNLINAFLFLFFSGLFNQAAPVSSIMAWVFFVLNAAFSLILLIMILVHAVIVLWYKNPDVRFKPARDDRFSFQKNDDFYGAMDDKVAQELLCLGNAAKQHGANWEEQLQEQQEIMQNQEFQKSGQLYKSNATKSYAELTGDSSLTNDSTDNLEEEKVISNGSQPGLKTRLKSFKDKITRNNTMDSLRSSTPLSIRSQSPQSKSKYQYEQPTQLKPNHSHERTQSESKQGLMSSESVHDAEHVLETPNAMNTHASSDSLYNQAQINKTDIV